ncbi:MAG: SNF2-related protein [Steroidobacteraceae bacterium]
MLHRSDLHGYQRNAIEFGKKTESCALWLPPGYGKSSCGLTIYSDLRRSFDARRMLVTAPLGVARKVWKDELAEWAHLQGLEIAQIVGTPQERMRALRTPADIHTVNYNVLPWLEAQFIAHDKPHTRWPWDVVLADEAHRTSQQGTNNHKFFMTVRKHFGIRMIEATGTPSTHMYTDLWGQIRLLDGGERLGRNESAFLQRFFLPPEHEYARPRLRETAEVEIQELIKDIVFVPPLMDLPELVINPVRVELSPKARDTYKRLKREFIAEYGGHTLTAANSAVLNNKLLQLANGAIYYEKGKYVELHDAKLVRLAELLEDLKGRKVLIAYGFVHDLERIKRVLGTLNGRWRVLKTDADEEAWTRGELDWLLLHPESAGEGRNLHKSGAEDIVWFGMTPSLRQWQQLIARLFGGLRRIGKTGAVHFLSADGTIDDEYRELIRVKDVSQEGLLRALVRHVSST